MAAEATPEGPPPPPRGPRPPRGRAAWAAVKVAAVALSLVHPACVLLSRHSWLADLVSHFREPALAATVLACLVMARGHRRIALALAVLAAFQVPPLLRYGGPNPVRPDPDSPARVRLLLANVLHENDRYDALARLIRRERPDVVGIVEFSEGWRSGLADVREEFPYRIEYPAGARGLALWFRVRPTSLDPPRRPTREGNPYLHATFEFGGRVRHLWLVHPSMPFSRVLKAGNPEMDGIAADVRDRVGSRVVMGDLNSTDGSAHFHDFLKVSGLRDTRFGFGRQPTWPTDQPYRIGIDHVFVSHDLAVVSRRLGPEIGSDHFPVLIDLAPAAETKSAAQSAQDSRPSH